MDAKQFHLPHCLHFRIMHQNWIWPLPSSIVAHHCLLDCTGQLSSKITTCELSKLLFRVASPITVHPSLNVRLIPNSLVATSKFQINFFLPFSPKFQIDFFLSFSSRGNRFCNHNKATHYQKIQTLISKKDFEQNPILKDGKSKEIVQDPIDEEKGDWWWKLYV